MTHRSWPERARLGDHTTWRPEWTARRPLLWWYLTFDHLPAVVDHAIRAAAALEPLEHVDVPPREWLHLTLCEVGYRGEVDEARLEDGVRAVRAALRDTGPVELRLGPVNTLKDAVVLEAHPWECCGGCGAPCAVRWPSSGSTRTAGRARLLAPRDDRLPQPVHRPPPVDGGGRGHRATANQVTTDRLDPWR